MVGIIGYGFITKTNNFCIGDLEITGGRLTGEPQEQAY